MAGRESGAGQRKPRQRVDGVLLLDKPCGPGSTSVLGRAKYLFNADKAGHTGTLDPLASGLLPLCFGEATKFAQDLLDANKSYRASLRLGVTTASGDAEGEVLERREVTVSRGAIDDALKRFTGAMLQRPPMYSAIKQHGRPLYELARQGVTVEREARPIVIYEIDCVDFQGDTLVIDVTCSKGTYIRVLAEEIGAALGCGASLCALRRTRVAHLSIDRSVSVETLERMSHDERLQMLLPIDALVETLPRVDLDQTLSWRFRQGQRLWLKGQQETVRLRVYGTGSKGEPELLGIGSIDGAAVLHPTRLVALKTPAASDVQGGPEGHI
jgi:tRNA pseudouridine55 synthase